MAPNDSDNQIVSLLVCPRFLREFKDLTMTL